MQGIRDECEIFLRVRRADLKGTLIVILEGNPVINRHQILRSILKQLAHGIHADARHDLRIDPSGGIAGIQPNDRQLIVMVAIQKLQHRFTAIRCFGEQLIKILLNDHDDIVF